MTISDRCPARRRQSQAAPRTRGSAPAAVAPAAVAPAGGGPTPAPPARGGADPAATARRRPSREGLWRCRLCPSSFLCPCPVLCGPARNAAVGKRCWCSRAGVGLWRRRKVSPLQMPGPVVGTWLLWGALHPEPAGQCLRGCLHARLRDLAGARPAPLRGRKKVFAAYGRAEQSGENSG